MNYREAPSLEIQEWINTNEDITVEKLKGKIVIIYAFQMLCPGCLPHRQIKQRDYKISNLFF